MPRKKGDRYRGEYGLWTCVACGLVRRCKDHLLIHGWITYGCGRMCGSCLEEFASRPVGTSIDLGAGCRLVKVGEAMPLAAQMRDATSKGKGGER